MTQALGGVERLWKIYQLCRILGLPARWIETGIEFEPGITGDDLALYEELERIVDARFPRPVDR